jgi:hypothetical protein
MTIILFFLRLLCVFKWGLHFDGRRGLLLVTPLCLGACSQTNWPIDCYVATGPRQYNDSWFWVPRDSWQYFTVRWILDSSDSALLLSHLLHDNPLLYNLSTDYIENPHIVAYISIVAGFCLLSRYLALDVSSGSAILAIRHCVTECTSLWWQEVFALLFHLASFRILYVTAY